MQMALRRHYCGGGNQVTTKDCIKFLRRSLVEDRRVDDELASERVLRLMFYSTSIPHTHTPAAAGPIKNTLFKKRCLLQLL